MRILHITNWFPNEFNKNEAIWIKKHIEALSKNTINKVFHFNIIKTRKFKYSENKHGELNQTIIGIPFRQWFLFEILYGFWLSYQLIIKKIHKDYDIINFHIAYPMLTYWNWIKRWIKKPVVITEHWSSYHFNFGVKKKLPRVQKIFQQHIPIITVSQALAKDIKLFSGADFQHFVVPNVVDDEMFYFEKDQKRKTYLFMVSQWKEPKTPILVMQAFLESEISFKYSLKIGGYGPLWAEMESFVYRNKAEKKIELLGLLDSEQIADNMRQCIAFLHPSDYETFSVVCAEAVACGAFVIAPNIGGIPEVVDKNGYLLGENTLNQWKNAFLNIPENFNSNYDKKFSIKNIGYNYKQVLDEVVGEFKTKK